MHLVPLVSNIVYGYTQSLALPKGTQESPKPEMNPKDPKPGSLLETLSCSQQQIQALNRQGRMSLYPHKKIYLSPNSQYRGMWP